MIVIPLFLENRFIMGGYHPNRTFGSLTYFYDDDFWRITEDVADGAVEDITDRIRRPQWPRELPFWGLEDTNYSRYKHIFWRRASKKPERRGPRWFRCLMVDGGRVLVRDFLYGATRKKCYLPITANRRKWWNVYEPMSCKRTSPVKKIVPQHQWGGTVTMTDQNGKGFYYLRRYGMSFGHELEASYQCGAGYPIKHGDMYFTPFYYWLDKPDPGDVFPEPISLYAGFYTLFNDKPHLFTMCYRLASQQVFWTHEGRIDKQYPKCHPEAPYSNMDIVSYADIQNVPEKPNMEVLKAILEPIPADHFKRSWP